MAQLQARAREAGPWLTRQQRRQVTSWEERSEPAAAPAAASAAPVPDVSVPPATATVEAPARRLAPERDKRGSPRRPSTPSAPAALPTGIDAVADAARDVLEHTARLGTTIGWDRLCSQVKGLHELSEEQQRRALKSASARSRSAQPLAALITINGTPHPHYRDLARTGDGPAAQKTWQQAVEDVHASYRPVPRRPARRQPHVTQVAYGGVPRGVDLPPREGDSPLSCQINTADVPTPCPRGQPSACTPRGAGGEVGRPRPARRMVVGC